MRLFLVFTLLLPTLAQAGPVTTTAPQPTPATPSHPTDHWEFGFHSGALWSVGSNASPLDYTLLPQWLDLKTPAHFELPFFAENLRVRSRFTAEVAPIIEGPESYFIGLMLSPSIEWWHGPWAAFASAGGGVGWLDARGDEIEGAQGQDFNFTWFAQAGLIRRLNDRLSASASVLFQHISNGGQDEVNPGIDALGFTLGLSWKL